MVSSSRLSQNNLILRMIEETKLRPIQTRHLLYEAALAENLYHRNVSGVGVEQREETREDSKKEGTYGTD